jgi:hypothetical protein
MESPVPDAVPSPQGRSSGPALKRAPARVTADSREPITPAARGRAGTTDGPGSPTSG